MSNNFLISVRNNGDGFGTPGTSVGDTTYIEIAPDRIKYNLINSKVDPQTWLSDITGTSVLVFVHGFGNDDEDIVDRHTTIKPHLPPGVTLVSFDWPSGNGGLHPYADDKANAKQCAGQLIRDCLRLLLTRFDSAHINLFAHSMGAYVTENAFHQLPNDDALKINHVLMAAADVDRLNYQAGSPALTSFLTRCTDLTAYWSTYDQALQESATLDVNNKAIPLGLQGFPDRPSPCRGIECSAYYKTYVYPGDKGTQTSHVWYLLYGENPPAVNDFYADLAETIGLWPARAPTQDPSGFLLQRPKEA